MVFKSEDGVEIKINRLSYRHMREHGPAIQELYVADSPGEVIFDERFDKLIQIACDTPEDYENLLGLDQNEVWQLWEDFVELCRFEDFFTEAAESQATRQVTMLERQYEAGRKRFEMMQKSGLVPSGFSMDTVLEESMKIAQDPTLSGPGAREARVKAVQETLRKRGSTTSTPTSTAGAPDKSTK